MKKILAILALAIGISACSNKSKQADAVNTQAYKDSVKKAVQDSIRLDSFQRADAQRREQAKVDSLARLKAAAAAKTSSRSSYASNRTRVKDDYYEQTAPATQKKGWSSRAKGAAIGAGAGAVGGALIDKKHGRGAIVGGLLGAGAGYVIGNEKDKKNGR